MRILLALMSAGMLQAQSYNLTVYHTMDPTLGINGHLQAFMSTSFAFADNSFFTSNTIPIPSRYCLSSRPPRMRTVVNTPVQTTDATSWDFSTLNAVLPKLVAVGDHDPVLALPFVPPWTSVGGVGGTGQCALTESLRGCRAVISRVGGRPGLRFLFPTESLPTGRDSPAAPAPKADPRVAASLPRPSCEAEPSDGL